MRGALWYELRPFQFTYYPEGDKKRGRWFLILHETEIEDIGDGRMTEITMYCCTGPDCRTKSREDCDPCFYCDYEDDAETVAYKARLEALAQKVTTKEEWIAGYLFEKPDATASSVIADYNPIEDLGDRLGWFSFPEAEALIQKVRSQSG
jgi:hypothetical protein